MTRKVSVDSVGDASADDLLRFLYDLTFRQPSVWGWVVAFAFSAVPAWLAIVCLLENNIVGGLALLALACVIPGLRHYLLHRYRLPLLQNQEIQANDG